MPRVRFQETGSGSGSNKDHHVGQRFTAPRRILHEHVIVQAAPARLAGRWRAAVATACPAQVDRRRPMAPQRSRSLPGGDTEAQQQQQYILLRCSQAAGGPLSVVGNGTVPHPTPPALYRTHAVMHTYRSSSLDDPSPVASRRCCIELWACSPALDVVYAAGRAASNERCNWACGNGQGDGWAGRQ